MFALHVIDIKSFLPLFFSKRYICSRRQKSMLLIRRGELGSPVFIGGNRNILQANTVRPYGLPNWML